MINFMGGATGTGYGVISLNLLNALHKADLAPSFFPIGGIDQPLKHQEEAISQSLKRAQYFGFNDPCLKVWHQFGIQDQIGKDKKSCYTFFELDRLTNNEVHQLNYMDIVFSPTKWAEKVMRECGVTSKIVILNPGVDLEVFNKPNKIKLKALTPNTTIFINIGKFMLNKGSDIVLEAFNNAFEKEDDVLLVSCNFNFIKTHNFDGPAESIKWQRLYEKSKLGSAGKIKVIPGRLNTQFDIASLIESCDIGFFPARAEGWNLCLSEALALGKNCVATNYSAHTEFAEKGGCKLIEVERLEEAYDPPFFPAESGSWAYLGKNEMDQMVSHLRSLHQLKQEGKLEFNQKGYDLFRNEITWENAAKIVKENLLEK